MANRAGNVLSTPSLTHYMVASLSKDASPQLKTPYDAIALVSHAAMIAVGFRLIGLGEEHKVEAPSSDAQSTIPLPSEWNAQAPNYAFRYAHTQSSMEYLLKISRMGSKAVVMGMALGDDKPTTFDVRVDDFISQSSLPANPSTSSDGAPSPESQKRITDIFISDGRLSDIGALMRLNVIQKLLPSLQKEGYEDTSQTTSTGTSNQRALPNRGEPDQPTRDPLRDDYQPPARPYPFQDPLAQAPRRPGAPTADFPPPGFEDEYDMTRPPRGMGGIGGGPSFGNIGHRDLYPQGLGPNDPFRNIGPGLGGAGGGGMHPTFEDPLFGGQGGRAGGFDPQAPPGSRYDPVGPGGPPRGNGGGGFPGGGGFGGRPPNPFGGFGGGDFI